MNLNLRFFSFYGRGLARNSQPLVVVGGRRFLSCDGCHVDLGIHVPALDGRVMAVIH